MNIIKWWKVHRELKYLQRIWKKHLLAYQYLLQTGKMNFSYSSMLSIPENNEISLFQFWKFVDYVNIANMLYFREDCEAQLSKALMAIKKKPEGVYVQASTLGSLEALLEFLRV